MSDIRCPICKGSGLIKAPKTTAENIDLKAKAAKLLREQGFSIRAIMVFMHYKSPRAVSYLLERP
jgi:hypothetical protein